MEGLTTKTETNTQQEPIWELPLQGRKKFYKEKTEKHGTEQRREYKQSLQGRLAPGLSSYGIANGKDQMLEKFARLKL